MYSAGMDSISKYHVSVREDGLWSVIDTSTGEPAELKVAELRKVLHGLPKEVAEEWSRVLNARAKMLRGWT